MNFCPKCGAHHDPAFPCTDRAGEVMRDMGVERPPKMSKEEFRKLERRANRSMFIVGLLIMAGLILFLFASFLFEK